MNLRRTCYLALGAFWFSQVAAEQVAPHAQAPVPEPRVQIHALEAPPDFTPLGASPPAPATSDDELAERFAIVGRPVQNLQGQLLGQVDGVLVSADGRVQSVVLATGGLLGLGRDRYEVPWARVHWQRDGDYLTLDVGRQEVQAEFSAFETD